MICGFLGTLIGVERALALHSRWPYAAPLLTAVGALALLADLPAAQLMTFGSLGLVATFVVIMGRQPAMATATMALGALLWLIGNGLWLVGWPLYLVSPWWSGFLILTIAGERLELSRLLRLSRSARLWYLLAVGVFLAGLALSLMFIVRGLRLAGVGMLGLAWWLLRYDLARRTVLQTGVTRFIAVCLLSGYVWLGIGGVLSWRFGGVLAGPYRDALLHAVFVGFVLSMILGHAPIIFPAVLGKTVTYHPIFYAPLIVLHLSLLLRVTGDLVGWVIGLQWGGLLNVGAILLFLAIMAQVVMQARRTTVSPSSR
jgi:hypothetical protein